MPPFETSDLRQRALVWPSNGFDDYGQPTVTQAVDPLEINVRWVTKRTEALDPNGNTIALDAKVTVGRRVDIGSVMWLAPIQDGGKTTALSQWKALQTPTRAENVNNELMQVKTYGETPDLKYRFFRRDLGMMRYHDALPKAQTGQ